MIAVQLSINEFANYFDLVISKCPADKEVISNEKIII